MSNITFYNPINDQNLTNPSILSFTAPSTSSLTNAVVNPLQIDGTGPANLMNVLTQNPDQPFISCYLNPQTDHYKVFMYILYFDSAFASSKGFIISNPICNNQTITVNISLDLDQNQPSNPNYANSQFDLAPMGSGINFTKIVNITVNLTVTNSKIRKTPPPVAIPIVMTPMTVSGDL
jgi:hypothetical protein